MAKSKKPKVSNDEKLELELYYDKKAAYYEAIVNAWVTTKFESSKHLLNLSAGGIGLLVTLAMTLENMNRALFIVAVSAFLVSVVATLLIFHFNAKHLERVVEEKEVQSYLLKMLDWISYICFFAGLALTFSIGIVSLN